MKPLRSGVHRIPTLKLGIELRKTRQVLCLGENARCYSQRLAAETRTSMDATNSNIRKLHEFWVRWHAPIGSFIVGQPAVQLLNLLTGFLLLRWLDVREFAMFSMAFAFQSIVTQLTDIGYTGSVIALAGQQAQNPKVLGSFLRSARFWRSRTQWLVLLLAAISFPIVTWEQAWGWTTKLLLFATIVLGVTFQSWTMYGAALLANRALASYYWPQVLAAFVRLSMCGSLYYLGYLEATSASLLGALAVGFSGWSYRRSAQRLIEEPTESDSDRNAAMIRYLGPLIPGVAFTILQSQIHLGLIAIFGSTQNIAEVSALGRLGQLFVFFSAFVTVFVQPYVARLSNEHLLSRYLQILCGSSAIFIVVGICGWKFPGIFLWFLGPNYSGLNYETSITLASGCVGAIGGVLFAMHAARSWLFWWSPVVYIPTMLITQIFCISFMDLSQTYSVVVFSLIITSVSLLLQVAVGIYGFNIERQMAR